MIGNLYAYDRENGAFNGTASWADNPERPDQPLQPAFTTEIPPPSVPTGQVARWNGSGWSLVPDHRGETWFKGDAPVQIDFLGDPAEQGLTPEAPPPAPPPPPTSCSKLGLKRAFDEKGLWTTVRAMIAGNADFAEEWSLAIEIRISDPLIKVAVAGLAQLGIGLSDADVQALVTRANELVA